MFKQIDPKECFQKRHSITFEDKIKYCQEKALYQMAYPVDLQSPKSLNEKIIWLALNYHNPEIKTASDKITSKEWIASRIGPEYVVPLIATFDRAEDFLSAFDSLPQSFVVKSNCGWAAKTVKLVPDKSQVDLPSLAAELDQWLQPWNNYYYHNMCIGQEDITPRLLVEELLGEAAGAGEAKGGGCGEAAFTQRQTIRDYKLFVMNGKAQFFYVVDDRLKESQTKTFLDLGWNILPCHRFDVPAARVIKKPPCTDEMIRVGETLSQGFPLVRVDFYYVDGQLYVGEMTFTPGMFLSIEPRQWDYTLGELLDISMI